MGTRVEVGLEMLLSHVVLIPWDVECSWGVRAYSCTSKIAATNSGRSWEHFTT